MQYLMIYLAAVNLAAFALCGIDKFKARHDRWRIPEKTLFLSAIAGGSVGFMLGMKLFRHKTKHKSFTIGIPMIFILQMCLAVYLLFIR